MTTAVSNPFSVTVTSGGDHTAVLSEMTGYAAEWGVTGGRDYPLITVTNDSNGTGTGSIKWALARAAANGGGWIRFSPGVVWTIENAGQLSIPDNVTIDGRGADITVDQGNTGYLTFMQNVENVIFMYLKLQRAKEDLIHWRDGCNGLWLHHLTLNNGLEPYDSDTKTPDANFDIRNGGNHVTVSWCISRASDKGIGVRNQSEVGGPYDGLVTYATFHHNWHDSVGQRTPQIASNSRVHCYNDYVFEKDYAGVMCVYEAHVLIENAVWEPPDPATGTQDRMFNFRYAASDLDQAHWGKVKETGGYYHTPGFGLDNDPDNVFTPSYSYSLDTANVALRTAIRNGAGWQNVPFPEG